MALIIPKKYESRLTLVETEEGIKLCKDTFEKQLCEKLNLTRVSAPLFVRSDSGLNDNLNGVERPVAFDIKQSGVEAEIVHSLAKWKRHALGRYGFTHPMGLLTDMNAIRRDEEADNIHSIYVDQWDWERIVTKEERNVAYLKETVERIFAALKATAETVKKAYPKLVIDLPEQITFITSQELEDRYPDLTAKEREYRAAKEYGAVFINGIGGRLASGYKHDDRAPDYDDWQLNGDILVYYPILDIAMELSSMGIRVDAKSMQEQLEIAGCTDRAKFPFHQGVINDTLPLTIGGGIGQSRLCMFLLNKAHIGQVHASIWPEEMAHTCAENGIALL